MDEAKAAGRPIDNRPQDAIQDAILPHKPTNDTIASMPQKIAAELSDLPEAVSLSLVAFIEAARQAFGADLRSGKNNFSDHCRSMRRGNGIKGPRLRPDQSSSIKGS